MGLKKQLLRTALVLALLYAAVALLPKLGPQAPGKFEGVAAPPTSRPSSTAAPAPTATLPPGFPSMEFAPPEIEVPEGDPIPIDTKYGLSYTVPGDWRFHRGGVVGWEGDRGSVRFGDIADFGYDYCPEFRDGATKAHTGITGRNGLDVQTAAFELSRSAELIFRDDPSDSVILQYSDPTQFEIDGATAVRYSVSASNLNRDFDCDPEQASFDVVATQGYSNATVAVFMVLSEKHDTSDLSSATIEDIVSSLRRTK
jgi:hypothetical protein